MIQIMMTIPYVYNHPHLFPLIWYSDVHWASRWDVYLSMNHAVPDKVRRFDVDDDDDSDKDDDNDDSDKDDDDDDDSDKDDDDNDDDDAHICDLCVFISTLRYTIQHNITISRCIGSRSSTPSSSSSSSPSWQR